MVPCTDKQVWKGTILWLKMKYTSAGNPNYATHCYCKKLCLRLLDQWLKWIEKSFSTLLIQVHSRNTASSNNLLPLKVSLEKSILFRICHIDQFTASHHPCHLLTRMPPIWINECWRKWCFGFRGRAPFIFIQDIESHQIGWILMQWMNKWDASSSNPFAKRAQRVHNLNLPPLQVFLCW